MLKARLSYINRMSVLIILFGSLIWTSKMETAQAFKGPEHLVHWETHFFPPGILLKFPVTLT